MALKAKFPDDLMKKASDRAVAVIEQAMAERLAVIGEQAVNFARSQERAGAWNDVTGNLRSSIGYVIYRTGQRLIEAGFEGEGPAGSQAGLALADNIAGNYRDVWMLLVIVAGMNYAVHVESRGKDVLTGASVLAEKNIGPALEQLTKNLRSSTAWQQ